MTTNTYTLAASADDALEASGTLTTNGATILVSAGTRYAGFSFPTAAAPIAASAPIVSATLGYSMVSGHTSPAVDWKGHKVVNSAQFSGANDLSNRWSGAPTTASVADNATAYGTGRRTIDVTTIVQELVNQAGWTSSSRLTLIAKGQGGMSDVEFKAWDGGSNAPTLEIVTSSGAVKLTAGVRLSTRVGGLLL